jgi:hypothetical protein
MSETPRQEVLRRAQAIGVDVLDNSPRGGLDVNLWTPPGIVWRATGGHSLTVCFYTNRAAGWRVLLEDVQLGTDPCGDPDCETCEEE